MVVELLEEVPVLDDELEVLGELELEDVVVPPAEVLPQIHATSTMRRETQLRAHTMLTEDEASNANCESLLRV